MRFCHLFFVLLFYSFCSHSALIPSSSGYVDCASGQPDEGAAISACLSKQSSDKAKNSLPTGICASPRYCHYSAPFTVKVYGGKFDAKYIISVYSQYDDDVAPEHKEPCRTPKTDDQCNKGKTATVTGNDVFWASGNYKGCTFTAADGVFIKLADGSMTGDATSTGSTGKSWCETTDSSYNPADDEALSKNPAFSPAKDNDPKNCKNGWVQAGGGKFHCLNDTSGNVDAPPDKVNPEDGSINSDKDGKPKPPDAGVGKPPTGDGTGGDGGGGSGGDGGGGDCEGEDCEGGGGGTKPPARPSDPWADILDAADVARVKADTQSVQDELADFYRSAASGFQININKPAAGAMPSYGDITQGGQKISLSMSWLDKISFADGRAGVLVLCSLIAAYIILVRR